MNFLFEPSKKHIPQHYYNGEPVDYIRTCYRCKFAFLGGKREELCPKCNNAGKIETACNTGDGWALYGPNDTLIEEWPKDWPKAVDTAFLEDRGIKIV